MLKLCPMLQNLFNYFVNLSNAPSLLLSYAQACGVIYSYKATNVTDDDLLLLVQNKVFFLHSINRHHLNVFMLVNFGDKNLFFHPKLFCCWFSWHWKTAPPPSFFLYYEYHSPLLNQQLILLLSLWTFPTARLFSEVYLPSLLDNKGHSKSCDSEPHNEKINMQLARVTWWFLLV